MNNEPLWLIGAASVRGVGHVKIDLPNQDACEVAVSRDGSSIAAVVSDGAGSASRAEDGSNACVKIMIQCLLDVAENHREAVVGALNHNPRSQQIIQQCVTQGLQQVRDSLDSTGKQLQDFHHTFTGVVLTPTGGVIVQIGDSPAIIARADILLNTTSKRKEVDFFAKHEVYMPEKGEYANETSFVTQPNWLANLRYFPFHSDSHRAVLLMSDGAGELAISKGQAFRPFIGTLISQMLKTRSQQERDQVLLDNLTHPQADELTADDKTLIILCHRDLQKLAVFPLAEERNLEEQSQEQEPLQGTSIGKHNPPSYSLTFLPFLTFVFGVLLASAYFLIRERTAKPSQPSVSITKPMPIPAGNHKNNPAKPSTTSTSDQAPIKKPETIAKGSSTKTSNKERENIPKSQLEIKTKAEEDKKKAPSKGAIIPANLEEILKETLKETPTAVITPDASQPSSDTPESVNTNGLQSVSGVPASSKTD